MSKLKLATVFSGIGAIEYALKRMNIDYSVEFACDNGEILLEDIDTEAELTKIKKMSSVEEKKNYVPHFPMQMFLLTNFKEDLNFYKNSKGGMFGSKIYFNFDNTIKDIDDLANQIKDKPWSEFQ